MSLEMIIQGTPTWVWVLLAFLLYRGFKALQSGTAPLSKLAIVPVIFAAMGISHLVHTPVATWTAVAAWIVGLLAGCAAGLFTASRTRFVVDPLARTVMLPGSVVPLLLILATFGTKFWLGVEMATVTNAASLALYVVVNAMVSGVVAGMFGGRFLTYWRAMNTGKLKLI